MKKSEIVFNAILLPLDYLAIVLAALTAYFLRFISFADIRPVVYEMPIFEYINIVLVVAILLLIIFAIQGMYAMHGDKKILDEIVRVFLACSAGVMLVIVAIFMKRELFSSRFIILAAWMLAVFYVSFFRIAVLMVQRSLYKKGIGVRKVVLIGADKTTEELSSEFRHKKIHGLKIIAEFSAFDDVAENRIKELWRERKIDEIILADPTINKNTNLKLAEFTQINNLTFKYAADLFKTYAINIDVNTIAGIPIIELKRTPLDGWGRVIKRIVDIIGAMFLIIIFSPIMIATAIAIKLDSKGPIFFARKDDKEKIKRVGMNGKLFWYFKFRSMVTNAEKYRTDKEFLKKQEDLRQDSPLTKFKDDPRITRIGKIIRKFSIDELSEFFLVLWGKMSLVGPRPHLPDEVAKYKQHHIRVLSIKPGITGMAQVSGRSDLDFEEEVKLDVYYIENWSIKLDLQILFKTPFILFKKRKAL